MLGRTPVLPVLPRTSPYFPSVLPVLPVLPRTSRPYFLYTRTPRTSGHPPGHPRTTLRSSLGAGFASSSFDLRYLGARALCAQCSSVRVRIKWKLTCPKPVRAKTMLTRTEVRSPSPAIARLLKILANLSPHRSPDRKKTDKKGHKTVQIRYMVNESVRVSPLNGN